MAPKFALFTKGSKLPLNKGFKNMFWVTIVLRSTLDIKMMNLRFPKNAKISLQISISSAFRYSIKSKWFSDLICAEKQMCALVRSINNIVECCYITILVWYDTGSLIKLSFAQSVFLWKRLISCMGLLSLRALVKTPFSTKKYWYFCRISLAINIYVYPLVQVHFSITVIFITILTS